jgi:hypothetical protein
MVRLTVPFATVAVTASARIDDALGVSDADGAGVVVGSGLGLLAGPHAPTSNTIASAAANRPNIKRAPPLYLAVTPTATGRVKRN